MQLAGEVRAQLFGRLGEGIVIANPIGLRLRSREVDLDDRFAVGGYDDRAGWSAGERVAGIRRKA